ncbi:MAG: hypothetical protein ACOH2R_20175 [Pseudomonas sp.]
MNGKTEYLAPVSLWLVTRKKFLADGSIFIEPAWVGSEKPDDQGPIIFTSRMLAEVYAQMRNKYHKTDDSGHWKIIPLSEFDLLDHAHRLPGTLNCMMAFGFSMSDMGSIIVASGAPRVRYVPLPFDISKDACGITFSFNQWAFDFINDECKTIGVKEFEQDMEAANDMNKPSFERAADVAIASINVCRNPSRGESSLWGTFSVRSEKWVNGDNAEHYDKTMH